MGSQTLKILRQGVWASLTGGYFYDPHQGVFCNVVHLYLWIFLLCTPFVAYLYFPGTWLTWCIYCVLTSVIILLVKIANMALHRLYDRAQTMSEGNLKNQFFKITKETEVREDESGIELKVIGNGDSHNSMEHAISEASEENSMLSTENINSILDLKVDVHRKNSSESIEFMFYANSINSAHSQQDQRSLSKSLRSNNVTAGSGGNANTILADNSTKYLTVHPEHENEIPKVTSSSGGGGGGSGSGTPTASMQSSWSNSSTTAYNTVRQTHLMRKPSEEFKRRHQRRRLERQNGLDSAASANAAGAYDNASANIVLKLGGNQLESIAVVPSTCSATSTAIAIATAASTITTVATTTATRNETFLHPQIHPRTTATLKLLTTTTTTTAATAMLSLPPACSNDGQRSSATTTMTATNNTVGSSAAAATTTTTSIVPATTTAMTRNARLQRHRSSETHDERLKQQNRALFLPVHHEHHHFHHHHHHHHHHHSHNASGASSSGALAAIGSSILDADAMDLEMGGSTSGVTTQTDNRGRTLQTWILGSSSDVFIEDDSYTKSDFSIEQLDGRGSNAGRAALLLHQQQQLISHYPRRAGCIKRRRHSNATALTRNTATSASITSASSAAAVAAAAAAAALASGQQTTVRRIKSAALEIACPRPSVSNLSAHPNSVEAISGQQQIRNPQSALLPPPSKCLVRNAHANLCPQYGGNLGGGGSAGSSLNFGASASGSTTALIEPPIAEQADDASSGIDVEMAAKHEETDDCAKIVIDASGDGGGCAAVVVDETVSSAYALPLHILDDDIDVDDEEADYVPMRRRRSGQRRAAEDRDRRSAESDVAEILADDDDDDEEDDVDGDDINDLDADDVAAASAEDLVDDDVDEFKDFDTNLDDMIFELDLDLEAILKATKANGEESMQAAALHAQLEPAKQRLAAHDIDADDMDENEEAPCTSQSLRQRQHSTDSETENNNGSRSPLLRELNWTPEMADIRGPERALRRLEIITAIQQRCKKAQQQQQDNVAAAHSLKGEADSGCPSSDCEQVSASSKDMLLAGMDMGVPTSAPTSAKTKSAKLESNASSKEQHAAAASTESERKQQQQEMATSSSGSGSNGGRSLGAIPKVVKYRESDVTPTGSGAQLTKRRGSNPNSSNNHNNNNSSSQTNTSGGTSKTASSSTSSRSISADSFSADIHKMLWLMHGGAVDDRGRPIAGVGPDGAPIAAHPGIVPPNMSSAHFQFYQDAIQALNTNTGGPNGNESSAATAADCLTLQERALYDRLRRRNSKQNSTELSYNASLADFGAAPSNGSELSGKTPQSAGRGGGGAVVPLSSSSTLNARNAATLSIHGLINMINSGGSNNNNNSSSNERDSNSSHTQTRIGDFSSSGALPPHAAIVFDEPSLASLGGSGGGGGGGAGGGNTLTSSSTAQLEAGNAIASAATTTVLNVRDVHLRSHIQSYCDYWRPVCQLGTTKAMAPKSFYKYCFKCCGYERQFKISMDRLELLALFDRDLHWMHIVLAVLLSALVAYLGATILQLGYYKDIYAFLFCAVIAGAQYSLVKSVQPDAASPIHGFNKIVAYSRAIYFSVCAAFLLFLEQLRAEYAAASGEPQSVTFFGVRFAPAELTAVLLYVMHVLLLCFPIMFSLGLCPQINTFFMYLLEQVDMHTFGGNAAGSLLGAFLCVVRSVLGVLLLYGPLYAALAEKRGTQYIVFSIFCAMLIPLGYHLSRSASDFSHLWALIKHCIISTYRDDDEDYSAANAAATVKKTTAKTVQAGANNGKTKNGPKNHKRADDQIEMSSMDKLPQAAATTVVAERDELVAPNVERKSCKSKASSLGSSSQTLAGKTAPPHSGSGRASDSCNSMAAGVTIGEASGETATDTDVGVEDVGAEVDVSAINLNLPGAGDEHDLEKVSTASTTNPGDISTLTAAGAVDAPASGGVQQTHSNTDAESPDPLPKKLQNTVNVRLKNDLVVTTLLAVIVLGLHSSTVFTVLQPDLNVVLYAFTGALGLLLHYFIPQMRKHMPWLCFGRPLLRQKEYGQFEVSKAPQVMWFEKAYIYFCMMERNVLLPLLVISACTADAQQIANKFGVAWGTLIVAVCALKFVRNAYSDPTNQYLIVMFTVLLFRVDFTVASETFLIDYFFVSLAYRKCCDFLLKLQFIVTYIAPWQITWGSAFHAFAQPFSVPHSAMLFLQAGISAALSTPLNPFLGSAIFLTSYVRPIKFWERDYNTRRIDHSNTRLSSQLERDLGADDNNLNSIFYEHLTRSLQHSLCGDLLMGRWGNVNQGDCFVLASDYLNCLVHIIELGNGLCTFQMRGLEFRGTYCQQREVEAITEDVEDNDDCCCCDPGHLPRILSANAMFSTRWLAWQVVAAQYVLEGYSISDNLASATLQVFEYRKVLITYYIKSIIYYVVKNPKLEQWLASGPIQDALQHTLSRQFVDLDPIFNYNLDEDFDFRAMGITRSSFCYVYLKWINFCYDKRKEPKSTSTSNIAATQPSVPTATTAPAAATAASTATAANDSKSTPNLSNHNNSHNNNSSSALISQSGSVAHNMTGNSITTAASTTAATAKSQSQQQLRTRPQKSATMSGSATVNNHCGGEPMATSQSFANISRQTSESAPGLSGVGLSYGYGVNAMHTTTLDNNSSSLGNSSVTVTGAAVSSVGGLKVPRSGVGGELRKSQNKQLRKDDGSSPTATGMHLEGGNRDRLQATGSAANNNGNNSNSANAKLRVLSIAKDSPIVSLCLALGLLARRSLATASHSSLTGVEFFLHGLHALFKGDFRITSARDEWVFADMELLHSVVAPAVKMALKLQQDHISNPDEFLDPNALYEAIDTCSKDLVISHEADPVWRSAVLRGAPSLLALRHVMEDGTDEYRIIRLTKRFLSFRVIKLNRECVRGLWAGQQQELIYLRNRNPERGSIQNAKQALRNIINSSCDQPIGYPIYVSPLTTSYADTNEQLREIIGGAITLESIRTNVLDCWHRIRERCRQGCSSGSALAENANVGGGSGVGGVGGGGGGASMLGGESGEIYPIIYSTPGFNTMTAVRAGNVASMTGVGVGTAGSLNAPQFAYETTLSATIRAATGGASGLALLPRKPTSTTLLAGLLNREREREQQQDREWLRESVRGLPKSLTQASEARSSGERERERRATLPITSGRVVGVGGVGDGAANAVQLPEHGDTGNGVAGAVSTTPYGTGMELLPSSSGQSPRYAKMFSSSCSLGIGNIITTPGDYPRKSKGPMCLTSTTVALNASGSTTQRPSNSPLIEVGKKVIIVDSHEIYDGIDWRHIDIVWPCEEMRAKGGFVSWKGWYPTSGMTGYVVHYWLPNHADPRFRSHVNWVIYLLAINEFYVPVSEYGLREYDLVVSGGEIGGVGSSTEEMYSRSRRSSLVFELDELTSASSRQQHQRDELTPILGSSLESPTSQLAASGSHTRSGGTSTRTRNTSNTAKASKIQAVSSSSSEDEIGLMNIELQRHEMLMNMWKLLAGKNQQMRLNDAAPVSGPPDGGALKQDADDVEQTTKRTAAAEADDGEQSNPTPDTTVVTVTPPPLPVITPNDFEDEQQQLVVEGMPSGDKPNDDVIVEQATLSPALLQTLASPTAATDCDKPSSNVTNSSDV